jgi:hypothetical protein
MKNPFKKNAHKVLIAGAIIGTAVAGTIAYLFLTETGTSVRKELAGHISRIADAISGRKVTAEEAPVDDYLHHEKPKRPKSDKATLKEHAEAIAHHPHEEKVNEAEGQE